MTSGRSRYRTSSTTSPNFVERCAEPWNGAGNGRASVVRPSVLPSATSRLSQVVVRAPMLRCATSSREQLQRGDRSAIWNATLGCSNRCAHVATTPHNREWIPVNVKRCRPHRQSRWVSNHGLAAAPDRDPRLRSLGPRDARRDSDGCDSHRPGSAYRRVASRGGASREARSAWLGYASL